MSRSFKLFRLQESDSNIDAAENRLKAIQTILDNEQAIRLAESSLASAVAEFETADRTLRQAEQVTQSHRAKIKQTDDRLYSGVVSNPKELQDLQQEGEALRRYLETLEERQLEAMMEADTATENRDAGSANLDQVKGDRISAHAELNGEKTRLLGELERWKDGRQTTSAGVENGDLGTYERLRTKRRGIAVSKAVGGMCGACGTQLSSRLHQEARKVDHLAYCGNCRRILYVG